MPLLLLLSHVPVEAPLEPADEGVVPPVGLLLLLPLHGVLPGLVLVHLPREDAAPPDVKLVLAHLALKAPLLGVGTTNVILEMGLGGCLVATVLPSAGVANVRVDNIHVLLPVTSFAKALVTMFTLKSSYLVMDSLCVPDKVTVLSKLHTTDHALILLLLLMYSLVVGGHATLLSKPLPALRTLVE